LGRSLLLPQVSAADNPAPRAEVAGLQLAERPARKISLDTEARF